jgi:hypothetical protein
MEGLVSLEKLSIENCTDLTSLLQGMKGLVSLGELIISNCPEIQSLPEGIKGLTALKELWIFNCPDLERRCESLVTAFPGRPSRGTGTRNMVRRFSILFGTTSIQLQHVPN